jgi:hypothetical protein
MKKRGDRHFRIPYGTGSHAGTPLLTSGKMVVGILVVPDTSTDPTSSARSR